METLVIAVLGLLVIAACNQLAPKVGVASPLILLAVGVLVGFLPWVGTVDVDPDIILEVLLPPLLFGAAVGMPVMDFRRELRSVAGLAIGLVVVSALAIGFVVHALVPVVSLAWAIALGAVLSPTDAVAVSIARGAGVNHRIITILEGEGLFNDATALVLLSAAVSAGQAGGEGVTAWGVAGEFVLALGVAVVIGLVVGELGVRVRGRNTDPAADTVFSFVMPFLASVPAEHLGGSGLVAAVVAGLVVSRRRVSVMGAQNRRFAQQNWKTVELVLEGGIFLFMGLQAYGIYHEVDVLPDGPGVGRAVLVSVVAGALTVLVRALFVAPLLAWLASARRRNARRVSQGTERLTQFEERLSHACDVDDEMLAARNLTQADWERALDRWRHRLDRSHRKHARVSNDLAYWTQTPLGPREGAVIVWAGMRGAVTLAAAQTLPLTAPMRPLLLLVALLVAGGSLVIQGLTLIPLIARVKPQTADPAEEVAEQKRLLKLLGHAVKDTALARAMQEQYEAGNTATRDAGRSLSLIGRTGMAQQRARRSGADDAAVQEPLALTAGPIRTAPVDDRPAVAAGDASGADAAPAPVLSADPSVEDDRVIGADELEQAEQSIEPLTREQVRDLAIEAIHTQRDALVEARDEGLFHSSTLELALERLDAEEIMLSGH